MQLNILIISKEKWTSRLKKHDTIRKMMVGNTIEEVRFDTIKIDTGKPDIKDGRITDEWFEQKITKVAKQGDYNFVIFQFSERDGKRWGVDSSLRGHTVFDTDFFGESWICCDENSVVKFNDGTVLNKYMKVVPHEIAHELKIQGITQLEIHDFDYKNERHDVIGFYKKLNENKMNWAKYLPEPYFSTVTQGFAVPNPLYKLSGHHVGVDHGVQGKKDVPVFMPCDGKITRHYTNDPMLGNCAVILSEDENWAFRFAHMKDAPTDGQYRAGTQIGVVGTTGLSTSEHLHVDCFRDGIIRIDKIINRASILEYCVDAHELVIKHL